MHLSKDSSRWYSHDRTYAERPSLKVTFEGHKSNTRLKENYWNTLTSAQMDFVGLKDEVVPLFYTDCPATQPELHAHWKL